MAVTVAKQTTPSSTAGSGTTVTYTSVAIGAASNDRIVVIAPTSEDSTAGAVTGVTVQPGGAGHTITLLKAAAGQFAAMNASCWYGLVPDAGTTATVVVTYTSTAPAVNNNLISSYLVTGAEATFVSSGSDGRSDIDGSPSPLTAGVTIPTSGGAVAVACGANSTTNAKTWGGTGTTEREEVGTGNYCHTSADNTTAGSPTITCTGGTNGEDGAMAIIVFTPAIKPHVAQSEWVINTTAPVPGVDRITWTNPAIIPAGLTPDTTNLPTGAVWGPPKPPVRRTIDPNSWISVYYPQLTFVQPPFYQTDWPNPKGLRRLSDPSWINASRDLTPPFFQTDWTNPKRLGPALDTSTRPQNLGPLLAAQPFSQTEWPNPKGSVPPRDTFAAAPQNLSPLLAAKPFGQTDWSNPKGFSTKDGAWINPAIQQVAAQAPFSQTDWPNPRPSVPANLSFSFTQQLVPDTTTYMPASAVEWDRPPATRAQQQQQEVNRLPLTSIQVAQPFSQNDWPNAKPPRPTALRDWINGLPPIQYVSRQPLVSVPKPPLPPVRDRDHVWPLNLSIATFVPPPPPIRNYDWPLATRARPPISLRDYAPPLNLLIATATPAVPPIRNYDFPLAHAAALSDRGFAMPPGLPLMPPPAPPATDELHFLPFFATVGQLKSF